MNQVYRMGLVRVFLVGQKVHLGEVQATNLHDVVLPHVGKVTVAVGGIEASEERGAFVDVVEADQTAEAVQEVGVTQGPENVPEDGRLV